MLWTKFFLWNFNDLRSFMFRFSVPFISSFRSMFFLLCMLLFFHCVSLTETDFLFVVVYMSKFENCFKLTMDLLTNFCGMLFGLIGKFTTVHFFSTKW